MPSNMNAMTRGLAHACTDHGWHGAGELDLATVMGLPACCTCMRLDVAAPTRMSMPTVSGYMPGCVRVHTGLGMG